MIMLLDDDDDSRFTIHKRQMADSRYLRRAPLSKGGQTTREAKPLISRPQSQPKQGPTALLSPAYRRQQAPRSSHTTSQFSECTKNPCPAPPNSHQSPE